MTKDIDISRIINWENLHPNGFNQILLDRQHPALNSPWNVIKSEWKSIYHNQEIYPDIPGKRINVELCDPDETLADTKDCLSDFIGVKCIRFNSSSWSLEIHQEYQLFSITTGMNKLSNIDRGSGTFKRFSPGSGFTGQVFTGELSRVNSAEALRQGIRSESLLCEYSTDWS